MWVALLSLGPRLNQKKKVSQTLAFVSLCGTSCLRGPLPHVSMVMDCILKL